MVIDDGRIVFSHLHCHTKYSIQDAMPSHKDYVDAIYQQNQTSTAYYCNGFAATDHGVIYGLVKQYNACNKPDHKERITKAIYGCEVYHCVDLKNNPDNHRFHLVLLAATQEGLENLYQIVSHAGLHTYKGRQKTFPITDMQFMKDHGKGIIALTACVGGIVPQAILNGQDADAIKYIQAFESYFDEVYLEVQPYEFPEQLLVNERLVDIAAQTGRKLVMTSDSHYISTTDRKYHNILKDICHQLKFQNDAHLYSPEEMETYCMKHGIPLDCIENTGEIAAKCNVDPKPKDHMALLPKFPCPEGHDEASYLRNLSYEMLQKKVMKTGMSYPDLKKYFKQMAYELEIICNAGFAGYFLILWDWFKWCRENDILCGPGRGSAAGSIVSYALNITTVDPIKNGFFFERFLNPGRVEFPDIDTDIPRSKRAEAIAYLQGKYGADNVSQIITFGEYKLKNTIKAIMSHLNCPYQEGNEITRDIPDMVDGHAVNYDLIEDVHDNPDSDKYATMTDKEKAQLSNIYNKLQELFRKYPIVYAGIKNVCGCIASTGIHAGGVVVCREPINHHCGVINGGDTAVLPLIQWEMTDLDFSGFLKIDALGLKTLDVISECMKLSNLGYDWYDSEDYTDADVYTMLRNGETTDIFQMSTFTPTTMLVDFDTHTIDDICAVNAGNRPGPLEKDLTTGKSMVDTYAERIKTKSVDSIHPDIDPILKKTMGCVWYQEHCIEIGKVIAGYDAGAADLRVRKTLGKKLKKKIPEIRNEFIYGKQSKYDEDHNVIGISEEDSPYCEGGLARGYSEELCNHLFDVMEAFAKYSFNRSHAFCYAVIAYKTAWLSYHYPLEFAVANCTVNEDSDNVTATLNLAKKRKISILPPDINKSGTGFTIDNGAIRYGLKAIKGLGAAALIFLDNYRKADSKPFTDFDDFYNRISDGSNPVVIQLIANLRKQTGKNSNNPIKKDVYVSLILSGAFDFCNSNRYELLFHYIWDIRKENSVKVMDTDMVLISKQLAADEYKRKVKLALEKFYMGGYISEHPLDPFPYEDIDSAAENQVVRTTGIVKDVAMKFTKKGSEFMSLKITTKDDIERTVNVFSDKITEELRTNVKRNSIVIVTGKVSKKFNNINASRVSIVAFRKQQNAIDTEDIDIPSNTVSSDNLVDSLMKPVQDVGYGNVF